MQFIEKISEFSSQLIIFLSFHKCCLMSSLYDDDNNNNDIIHLYSKKNSVLHQYAEEHSHAWSHNATFTSTDIRQKFTDSDLWVSETLELIFSLCSQCWDIFTQFIKIINKNNKTVKIVMNIIDDVRNVKRVKEKICFKHQKKLIRTAEFQVRLLNSETLQDWLQTY